MEAVAKEAKEKSRLTKDEWREYTKTVWHIANVTDKTHPAVFPLEIPHRLVKLFSLHGESVLDPFAGVGTTAMAALPLGRNVICVDQNTDYVKEIRKRCATLQGKDLGKLTARTANSSTLQFVEDESVGVVVTSPPYWNKADYGKRQINLGNERIYAEFLRAIEPVFRECYRVLMPGRKICIVTANVNQHTNHGLLTFPLALDYGWLLRDIGFVMVNEVIWSKDGTGGKWGSANGQRPIFGSYPFPPNFLFKNVHEYILIFAKPKKQRVKGPKVMDYDELYDLR
ncbi:MAG: DNA methyltransferase [Planctomycetota bacterium]|jgi:site-specific DNA-methyltransferase (adenine-specific)